MAPALQQALEWQPLGQGGAEVGGWTGKRGGSVPEISRFLGIVNYMFFDDHPPPHLHARYGPHEIVVYLENGLVEGRFPKRSLRHVLEWFDLHKEGLASNWELVAMHKQPTAIAPLE
jgi:hypothetical protein